MLTPAQIIAKLFESKENLKVFYLGRCTCRLHACPSNMLLSQSQYYNFQQMLQMALPALDFYGCFSRQMGGEIIMTIKRISRAPIYCTRWESTGHFTITLTTHTRTLCAPTVALASYCRIWNKGTGKIEDRLGVRVGWGELSILGSLTE